MSSCPSIDELFLFISVSLFVYFSLCWCWKVERWQCSIGQYGFLLCDTEWNLYTVSDCTGSSKMLWYIRDPVRAWNKLRHTWKNSDPLPDTMDLRQRLIVHMQRYSNLAKTVWIYVLQATTSSQSLSTELLYQRQCCFYGTVNISMSCNIVCNNIFFSFFLAVMFFFMYFISTLCF